MRGRRQADDQEPRPRVSEAWDGLTPIDLCREGGSLLPGHLLAPLDKARAAPAVDEVGHQEIERARR